MKKIYKFYKPNCSPCSTLVKMMATMNIPNDFEFIELNVEDEKNKQLSLNRAKAVADYLIQKGIDPVRLSVKGYGAAIPIASNDTDAGRQTNRRIEFRIVK